MFGGGNPPLKLRQKIRSEKNRPPKKLFDKVAWVCYTSVWVEFNHFHGLFLKNENKAMTLTVFLSGFLFLDNSFAAW